MTAGLDHANGEVIISMDGDLQHDPEDIPALLEKAAQETLFEFIGQNVSINSQLEADEILVDLDALATSEAVLGGWPAQPQQLRRRGQHLTVR